MRGLCPVHRYINDRLRLHNTRNVNVLKPYKYDVTDLVGDVSYPRILISGYQYPASPSLHVSAVQYLYRSVVQCRYRLLLLYRSKNICQYRLLYFIILLLTKVGIKYYIRCIMW